MPAQAEPYDAPAVVTFAKEPGWRRTSAGLSKKALADALGFADSCVGQIELCKNLPSDEFAEALDTCFGSAGLFARLRRRIVETRHVSTLPPGFTAYVKCEEEARSARDFELAVDPQVAQEHPQRPRGGSCVEVANLTPMIAVRDSRDPDGPELTFSSTAWHTFTTQIKADRHDLGR